MPESISILSQENAEIIANNWHYEGAYAFYDMVNDKEDYDEIISSELRDDRYFQITQNGELLAFFCLEPLNDKAVEVGLGLRPDLTGQGLGGQLMTRIEAFVVEKYDCEKIVLSVASFNLRALKVYLKAGYVEKRREILDSNGSKYEFIILEKRIA